MAKASPKSRRAASRFGQRIELPPEVHGINPNLVDERAADVVLKERGHLLLVPRETPYSVIHLENMLKLTQLGATILPASPGFYHKPQSIDDLVNFLVARILDHLHIKQVISPRWSE